MHALFGVMEAVHFQPQDLDDDLSKRAFNLYMASLDGSKRFLLREEVAELEKYELDLDDQVGAMSLKFLSGQIP